ncbi:hypothetical protein Ancab_025015 [Ancistrocladus abbreviatus]
MEAFSLSSPCLLPPNSKNFSRSFRTNFPKPVVASLKHRTTSHHASEGNKLKVRVKALDDISAAADPAQAQVTWQIVVGALAGVTPFVVAGIEFSKRIVAQRRCGVCGGSGLVQREKYYFRCPSCGGFLPWQSWKRFFSG